MTVPHEHLPLPVALIDAQRDEGMMMGVGLPYLHRALYKKEHNNPNESKQEQKMPD